MILFNHSDREFKIESGNKVAQMIVEKIYMPRPMEVEKLDVTDRNTGGFGSTGI